MNKVKKYFYDDIKSLGELLVKNWTVRNPTTIIYYRENSDPNAHNFKEDEVSVFITEGETTAVAGGIAYDSAQDIRKNMYVYVSSICRENMASVVNEVMRILAENRLYSFNEWDMITILESKRVVPAYRYFQWLLKVELRDILKAYPNPSGCFDKLKE